jgi:hypothetical protein
MSEAAIILGVVNFILAVAMFIWNIRQHKILSELRKDEKLFDVTLSNKMQRLAKIRELVLINVETNDSMVRAFQIGSKSADEQSSLFQRINKSLAELDSLITSTQDKTLLDLWERYRVSHSNIKKQVTSFVQNGQKLSTEPLELWVISSAICIQTYEIENALHTNSKQISGSS